MDDAARGIFTVLIVILSIGVCLLNPKADHASPDWVWRGGANDLLRNLLLRADGSFRRYTKAGILAWFLLGLILIWLVF